MLGSIVGVIKGDAGTRSLHYSSYGSFQQWGVSMSDSNTLEYP